MGGPKVERPFYLNWQECANIILNSCTADPPSRCSRPTVSGEHQGSAIRGYNARSATDYRLLAVSCAPYGRGASVGRGRSDVNPTYCNPHKKAKGDEKNQYLPVALADQGRRNAIILLRVEKRIDEIPCEHRHVDCKRDGEAISIQQLCAAFDRQYDQRRNSEIDR